MREVRGPVWFAGEDVRRVVKAAVCPSTDRQAFGGL